jgi:hypothetical protein
MENVINYLLANITQVISIIVILVGIVVYIRNGQLDKARQDIYKLVLQAEKEIVGTQVGEQRLNFVLNAIKAKYPKLSFIPNSTLINVINLAVQYMNDVLSDGKLDGKITDVEINSDIKSNIIINSSIPDASSNELDNK